MIRTSSLLISATLLGWLQLSWGRDWTLAGAAPDLLLVLALSVALTFTPRASIPVAWFLGLWHDLLFGSALGAFALAYSLAAAAAAPVRTWLFAERVWIQAAVAWAAGTGVHLGYGLIASRRWPAVGPFAVLGRALAIGLCTALAGAVLMQLLGGRRGLFRPRRAHG